MTDLTSSFGWLGLVWQVWFGFVELSDCLDDLDCSGILVDSVDWDGREQSSKAPSQQTSCDRPFHRNVAVPRATEGRPGKKFVKLFQY